MYTSRWRKRKTYVEILKHQDPNSLVTSPLWISACRSQYTACEGGSLSVGERMLIQPAEAAAAEVELAVQLIMVAQPPTAAAAAEPANQPYQIHSPADTQVPFHRSKSGFGSIKELG